MFIRNGILSVLRERGRTALFSLLIMFLTVMMILYRLLPEIAVEAWKRIHGEKEEETK